MSFLVRKISRAKWPERICPVADLVSDAISDIKTSGNELSVWMIESLEDLDSAVLALAASAKTTKIETVQVVWIPTEIIEAHSIDIRADKLGDTIVPDLAETHRDLCDLTYASLGKISEIILDEMITKHHYKVVTRVDVRKALVSAYITHRIPEDKCSPKLLEEIKKYAAPVAS